MQYFSQILLSCLKKYVQLFNRIIMKVKSRKQVYQVALNATLGSFLIGYQLVNISSLQRRYGKVHELNSSQTQIRFSVIVAALPLTAILGSIMIRKMMKLLKARKLMIALDLATILFLILEAYSFSFWSLFFSRLCIGFSVGINSGLVPQYIYSVTPRIMSSSVCALHAVMMNIGVTVGYSMGFLINPQVVGDQLYWRILIAFPAIFCGIRAIILMLFLQYQIPSAKLKEKEIIRLQRYYYNVYQNYQTGQITSSVQFPSSPSKQDSPIKSNKDIQEQKSQEQLSNMKKALIICLVLVCSNQFSGINAILFYAKQMFMRITDGDADLSQILIVLLGLAQTIAAWSGGIVTDKFSKKYCLIIGELIMVLVLGGIFVFSQQQNIVIILVFVHSLAYNFSVGQLYMYYAAKMLQSTGNVMVLNWSLIFIVAISTEMMMRNLGIDNMCLLFAILLLACVSFLIFSIPADDANPQQLQQPLNRQLKSEESEKRSMESDSTYDYQNERLSH